MADIVIDEKALQADIDEVRTRFTDTKELYKWVCSLLFFRYGITPTTNRLYQLVRKGSMQTVTTALSTFWQDLRERSRIKIDHPGVPDSLIDATGDLIQALWEKANIEAKAYYDAAIAEARNQVATAEVSAGEARATALTMQSSVATLDEKLNVAGAALATSKTETQSERQAHAATGARLDAAQVEAQGLRDALADARKDFGLQLDKAREAVSLAEERLQAAERRALLEIDRERTARSEAMAETDNVRKQMATMEADFNSRLQASATEQGALRGRLEAAVTDVAKREIEIAEFRERIKALEARAGRAENELEFAKTMAATIDVRLKQEAELEHRMSHDGPSLMRIYDRLAAEWNLDKAERLALVGVKSAKTLAAWAELTEPIPEENFYRFSYVFGIYKCLQILFKDKAISSGWIRRPNTAETFGGRPAIDLMLKDDSKGLADVRAYLEAACQVNN